MKLVVIIGCEISDINKEISGRLKEFGWPDQLV